MPNAKNLRLYHCLQQAAHRVQKAADRALMAAAEITTAQAAVLTIVAAQGGVTQREVAKALGLTESAVTGMVARLLNTSLLERTPHDLDVRAWQLRVSARGRATLKSIDKPFRAINATIEDTLEAEEIARLADYLQRLATAFEQ